MKKMIVLITCISVVYGVTTFASSVPRSVSADHRVKLVQYDPNNIVILKGHYGYQTQITFSEGEHVQNVSLGDSLAWQAVPVGNYLFIKPMASSKTNMTVLTNLNSYNFQLDSESQESVPTYKLQFLYTPDITNQSNLDIPNGEKGNNYSYSFTGSKKLIPLEAFDKNNFTYLKFSNGGASVLPAVYKVDEKGNESLVNYHMQQGYMILHTVGKQYTLRHDDEVTSLYNDALIGDWHSVRES